MDKNHLLHDNEDHSYSKINKTNSGAVDTSKHQAYYNKQSEIESKTVKSSMQKSHVDDHHKASVLTAEGYVAKHQFGVTEQSEVDPMQDDLKKSSTMIEQENVKKLSPLSTYFSLLKGFIATGILYMPKNFHNAGWLWALISMFLSFILTLVCITKLLQARAVHKVSFTELGQKALGMPGKYLVDLFLTVQQIGFVIGQIYFITSSMHDVILDAAHYDLDVKWWGLITFVIITPLAFVRRIEMFAIFYIFADCLILITAITIIVYASKHASDEGWGSGVVLINTSTWLSMIGSAVYAYEGIGVVIPLLDVTEKPELFPKILFAVLCTVFVLYTFFGEFCYFVYGDELTDPLITANLPHGVVVYLVKIFFSINMFITCPLQIFPANIIIESYIFTGMEPSRKRSILKNISRTIVSILAIIFCLLLDKSVDKFLSLIGTLACTPISFATPAILHLKLCNPTKIERIIDIGIVILAMLILVFCTGFTIWTWND